MNNKKIGIALSGGAARGFAHIGVLKALNEEGIYPDIIAGTSAGAVIGAYYADGKTPDEILEIFKGIRIFDLLKVGVPRGGIMTMENVIKFLSDNLTARTFEELKLPLYVNSVNLNKGKNVFFQSGSLIDKICASCAIPFIYMPVQIEEDLYVDGGLMVNLPVDPLINHCDFIIGVNLNPTTERNHFPSVHSVLIRSYHLTVRNNIKPRKSMCDLFLEVSPIENHSHFDISKGNEMYTLGYTYAKKILNQTGISEVLAKTN